MNIQVIRSSLLLNKGVEELCVPACGTVSKALLSGNAQRCWLALHAMCWEDEAFPGQTLPGSLY